MTGRSTTPRHGRTASSAAIGLFPQRASTARQACGLLAYVDKDTGKVRRFEGNPAHPGSRGRNCAKGPGNA